MSSADFWLSLPADISALPSPGSATAEASLEGVSTAAMTPFGGGGKRHLTIPGYASGVRRRMLATAPRQWVENTTGHRSPPIHRRGEKIRPSGLYVPTASPLRLFYWCFKVLPDLLGQIWDTGHGNDHEAGRIAVAGGGETEGRPHAVSPLLLQGGRGEGGGEGELETWGFVDRREADKNTLGEVLRRYQREVTPAKKSADIESIKIDVILKDASLPKLKMSPITSTGVASWRDRRLKEVSGATVNREIDVLSTVLNHARREWGIHLENPIPYVKRPDKARARDRRFSAEEEAYLLAALTGGQRQADGTYSKGARNPWLLPLVQLAIETAMRRGELLALEWEHVDLKRQTAHLPDTKNGDARTVPLSTRAVAILAALPQPDADEDEEVEADARRTGRVFATTALALRKGFTRSIERAQEQYVADCKAAKRKPLAGFLVDVHFHDTRHEAASRLAEKLSNVLELSAVTGHRDLRMLKRYYHPRAEDLAKKLG